MKKYNANQLSARVQPAPPPLTDMDGHTRYIVEKVLSHKKRGARTHYLVKWKGYRDATWEPEEYLIGEAGNELIPLQNFNYESSWMMVYHSYCLIIGISVDSVFLNLYC